VLKRSFKADVRWGECLCVYLSHASSWSNYEWNRID